MLLILHFVVGNIFALIMCTTPVIYLRFMYILTDNIWLPSVRTTVSFVGILIPKLQEERYNNYFIEILLRIVMIFCIVPFTFLLFDFFALTLPVTEPWMLLCTSRLFMSCRLQLSGVLMFLGVQGTLLWCVLHLLMGMSACFLSWVEVPLDKIFNNKKWVPSNWSQL